MSDATWTGAIGIAIGAFVAGLWGWLTQHSKGQTDRDAAAATAQAAVEVAVMAEWQKLNGALSLRVSDLEQQLATARSQHSTEIESIRKAHATELDEMRRQHRTEMKKLREYAEGLERQIAQNSQSTAHLMGDMPTKGPGNDK